MTFLDLAYKTLEKHNGPLTVSQIWEKSAEFGYRQELGSFGQTPIKTLAARLYVEIRDNPDTNLYQVSKRPAMFYIKDRKIQTKSQDIQVQDSIVESGAVFHERDLHPLLTAFVYSDSHFNCVSKTIHHEMSKKKKKGVNEWLHPDLVGLYFPYNSFGDDTLELMDSFSDCQYRMYSFEMKIGVNFSNLREYYFQAVSNSSWANEGYLVALRYADDPELQEEMLRLSNAFGIGFIKLNPESIEQSEILYPARYNESIDWDTVDKLSETNKEFNKFIKSAIADIKGRKIHLEEYDKVLKTDELLQHIKDKNL